MLTLKEQRFTGLRDIGHLLQPPAQVPQVRGVPGLRVRKHASEGERRGTGVVQAWIRGIAACNSPRHLGLEAHELVRRPGFECY